MKQEKKSNSGIVSKVFSGTVTGLSFVQIGQQMIVLILGLIFFSVGIPTIFL